MKHLSFLLYLWAIGLAASQGLWAQATTAIHTEMPATLIENQGQWPEEVRFRVSLPGGFIFLKNNSLQYSLYDSRALEAMHAPSQPNRQTPTLVADAVNVAPGQIQAHGVVVVFEGASPTPRLVAKNAHTVSHHFLLGQNATQAKSAKAYQAVRYEAIYPGISLDFELSEQGRPKYTWMVAAQADPSQIILNYQHSQGIYIAPDGTLRIRTGVGEIVEAAPRSFQTINGQRQAVSTAWVLLDGQRATLQLGSYDAEHPLEIDPELIFSTYSGSIPDNWGSTATFDLVDNFYLGGIVFGTNFPVTVGAFRVSFSGEIDVVVMKFDPTGRTLLYATYLGGSQAEFPHSLVVNQQNELVIFGTTSSLNFPTTATAFSRNFQTGTVGANFPVMGGINYLNGSDLFVSILSSNGANLRASTYVGGNENDGLNLSAQVSIRNYGDQFRGEVIVDEQNNVYIASTTNSFDFPTLGAFKTTREGLQDAVLLKLNPDLSALLWSTYFGGNGFDAAYSLRLSSNGELYVVGGTRSTNLPTQPGAWLSNALGNDDGYVLRLSNTGTLIQCSYLGTSEADQAFLLDLDAQDNVYVLGQTLGNYPRVGEVYFNQRGKQFLHQLDKNLQNTGFSTVFGAGRDVPDITFTAFLVNECGNIYISGWGGAINDNGRVSGVRTNGLPTTIDAFRRNTDGNDFYLLILSAQAQRLLYGSFFGSVGGRGNHVDGGTCRFNKRGVIFHAACACSPSGSANTNEFPTTPGVWSRFNRSTNCNAVAFKFDTQALVPDFQIINPNTLNPITAGCLPLSVILRYTGTSASRVVWRLSDGTSLGSGNEIRYTFTDPGTFTILLDAFNDAACVTNARIDKQLVVLGAAVSISPDQDLCRGESVQLEAFSPKALSYRWSPTTGLSNPNIANPVASPTQDTRYTVTVQDTDGCDISNTVNIRLIAPVSADFAIVAEGECAQQTAVTFQNNTDADTFFWDMGDGTVLNGAAPERYVYAQGGNYQIRFTAIRGNCQDSFTQELLIEDNLSALPNVITPNGDGRNDTFVLPNRSGYSIKIYNRWGQEVFSSDAYNNDWGTNANTGTYYYVLRSPQGVSCKGWIEVVK
jgi:gliding motility-associated-like protein